MATFVLNTLLDVLLDTTTPPPPDSSYFFGFMGCASALVFACLGSAYGTAKSGVGVANMGVTHPEMVMRSIIPVVMAGIIGIYGLIIAVIISTGSMYFLFLSPCFLFEFFFLLFCSSFACFFGSFSQA